MLTVCWLALAMLAAPAHRAGVADPAGAHRPRLHARRPVDIIARLMAAQLGERFGQQAIVEGKPGAGGTVGAAFVAKSEPDGYTLFLMASGHAASRRASTSRCPTTRSATSP